MSSSGSRKPVLFTAFGLAFLILLSGLTVSAQVTTGTIKGTVTDESGGVVAGASVVAKNEATGVTTDEFKTTGEGLYVIPNLIPGKYEVSVTSTGFSKTTTTSIDVRLGQDTTINVTLKPGDITAVVTVTAGTEEIVNRDQSQISASFETRKIEELPFNVAGGGIDTLALLAPGVINNPGAFTNTNGAGLSVNGQRGRSNNFQIDGSDNNDLSIGGPTFFVDNQDQVQEYQIITNNFSAQYGRNQGAIINQVLKAGTNDFHGTAFEYFRDRKNLDSLNNIERRSGQEDPLPRLRHVFGGVLGGPIVKNRAFFFGTYQGIRQSEQALARSGSVSILASELPRLAAAFPGNPAIDAIVKYSAFAIPFGTVRPRTDVSNPFDSVTIGGQSFQAALVERVFPTPFTQNEWSIRGDMKATDRDNFYVRYLFQDGNFKNSLGSTNGFTGDIPFKSKNFGGTYNKQLSTSMVNEFKAFYQSLFVKFGGGCETGSAGCIEDPVDIEDPKAFVENLAFTFLSSRLRTSMRAIGVGVGLPQGRLVKVYQFADTLSLTRGAHSFMFGAEYKHLKNEVPFLPRFNGDFTFNSATRLVNNAPSAINLAVGPPIISYTENDQYYFVQDDWKVRPNLTLNLGIRYEYTGQPINDLNDLTVARESGSSPLFNTSVPIADRVVPRLKNDKNNFAPRFGFAWTPRFWKSLLGEDATVIRGGYSIAYDPAFYNILLNISNSAPVSALISLGTGSLPSSGSPFPFPSVFGADIRSTAASSGIVPIGQLDPRFLTQSVVSRDFHAPYAEQWSLGIQRQINRNNVGEVRYVGTHGVGLFQTVNRNPRFGSLFRGIPGQEIPFDNEDGFVVVDFPAFPQFIPNGAVPVTCTNIASTPDIESACNDRLLAGHGRISARENTAQSTYNSLQARYNGRFLNNSLTFGASYTFSKTIDNASEIFADSEASVNAQNPFDIGRAERSLSSLDRPHAFAANFLYDVPFMKDQHGILGHILGGWQINGTQIVTSGRPFTPAQFENSSFLGAGFSYLPDTAGEPLRPFIGNPTADPHLVAISQVDAAFMFGIPASDLNGFWSYNELNRSFSTVAVTPSQVRFILNGPGAARIFGTPFGDMPRNYLRGPAINALNLGVFKNTNVTEGIKIQFRAEFFNALNHPSPGYGDGSLAGASLPDIFIGDASFEGSAFADKRDMELNRRVIQFGLRIIF
ncbi:MAG TPA: TonB-dependent receptor [Pyrinomonadaceae bacterium]|nr:TonB-dependent receptor [Pyrinomonadaceae bacterium]